MKDREVADLGNMVSRDLKSSRNQEEGKNEGNTWRKKNSCGHGSFWLGQQSFWAPFLYNVELVSPKSIKNAYTPEKMKCYLCKKFIKA